MEENGNNANTIGTPSAILLMVNAIAGAGVLNFPQVYQFCGGFIFPTAALIAFAALSFLGLFAIAAIGISKNAETYQSLLLSVGGNRLGMICSFIIIFYGFGSCTTYLIIIGDQLDRVLYSLESPTFCKTWYFRREFTIIVFSTFIILPNIYSKKADFLAYASQVGVIGIFYAVVMIVILYFIGNYEPGNIGGGPKDWNQVTYLIPTFTFAFHCHVQLLPVISCLRNKTTANAITVIIAASIVAFFMYCAAGIYGYATFGDKAMANVLLNYDARSPVVIVGLILICIKICCVYPLILLCGR